MAEQELASRTEMLEAQAQREIVDRTQRVENEARQWANTASAQHQTDLEQIRTQAGAAIAEVQRSRDEEIKRLEDVLARQIASQQKNFDGSQVPTPKTGSGLSTPQTRQTNPFGTPNSIMEPGHPLSIPMSFGPEPVELPPGLHVPSTPPNMPSAHTSVTSQQLAFSQPATPKAHQPPQGVTGQQAAGSSDGQALSRELGAVLGIIPKDDKGFAFMSSVIKALGGALDDVGSKSGTIGRDLVKKTFDEKLKNEMESLLHAHPPASSSQACVPIAAPCAPPQLQGAAVSAPPPPVSFLPAGMPPIPGNSSPVRGRPTSQHSNQGTRGRSGSSESSSPSHSPPPPYVPYDNLGNAAATSSGLPPSGATCRICGGQHDEINCPYLTMNQPQAPNAPSVASTRNYADEEEDTIRVKSLSDLTLPHPPKDAAQARGNVKQVLMSIGKLQKTHGHEVYAWAQECLSHDEDVLKADPDSLEQTVAAKLIKTCKTGKFAIIFRQMVETERSTTGGMPCGRVMLRMIFKKIQLERDRIGMLGERNLLQLKVPGKYISDLEAFITTSFRLSPPRIFPKSKLCSTISLMNLRSHHQWLTKCKSRGKRQLAAIGVQPHGCGRK